MELLSGDFPARPVIGTNTNQAQVKQSELIKRTGKVQIQNFKNRFIRFYYLLGMVGWAFTLSFVLSCYVIPPPSHISRNCPDSVKDVKHLYDENFSLDLHAFVSENETNFDDESKLIWRKSKLAYGDFQSTFNFNTNVSISKHTRNQGSLYLHVCVTKSGFSSTARKGDSWAELYTYCRTKRMNFFYQEVNGDSSTSQVRSYWRPNWIVNLVNLNGYITLGVEGNKDGRVECEPLTGKYYPILYLNDHFNLARNCIAIEQATEWLPLNLSFKQIGLSKLRNYLRQRDFEYYFRYSNLWNDEFIQRNLIASDFQRTGVFHIDHFLWIIASAYLAKCILFSGFELLYREGTNGTRNWSNLKRLYESFRFLFVNMSFVFLKPFKEDCLEKETVKSSDSQGKKVRKRKEESSPIEVPVKQPMPSDQVETNLPDCLLNFLLLECRVIIRNLVVLLLLPLLLLYLCFSLSLCLVDFSPRRNLAIFFLLALFNCFFYLTSIYWTSGLRLFFDSPTSTENSRKTMHLDALPFAADFFGQLIVLLVILFFFPLTGFSTPAFLVFMFAWQLSDLASSICLIELGGSIKKLKEMPAPRSKLD